MMYNGVVREKKKRDSTVEKLELLLACHLCEEGTKGLGVNNLLGEVIPLSHYSQHRLMFN